MPLQWNSLDTRYAVLSAAFPAGVALGGSLFVSKNEDSVNFLKTQRFPSCLAPSCQYFYLAANVGAAIPFGYASYLVYKIGGGFDYTDTTVALGLYGATIASGIVALPLLRTKKAKWEDSTEKKKNARKAAEKKAAEDAAAAQKQLKVVKVDPLTMKE
ncbi:hypothetical protein ACQ4LE_002906 [Meloidogyne hapla]